MGAFIYISSLSNNSLTPIVGYRWPIHSVNLHPLNVLKVIVKDGYLAMDFDKKKNKYFTNISHQHPRCVCAWKTGEEILEMYYLFLIFMLHIEYVNIPDPHKKTKRRLKENIGWKNGFLKEDHKKHLKHGNPECAIF